LIDSGAGRLLEAANSFALCRDAKRARNPDDLLRAHGAPALHKAADNAMPMVRLLWQRETDMAAFLTALNAKAAWTQGVCAKNHDD